MTQFQRIILIPIVVLLLNGYVLAAQDDATPTRELVTNTPVPTVDEAPVVELNSIREADTVASGDGIHVTDEPDVHDEEPPATPDEAGDYLLNALDTITRVAYAASLVLIITQILKVAMTRLLPQKYWISPAALALAVQVVFWVGHVVTNQLGYGQQYRDVLQVVESVLKAFQPLLPVTIVTGLGAHAVYNLAHQSKQPGFQMQVKAA